MEFWTAIVVIVAMSMLSGVIIEALKTRRKAISVKATADPALGEDVRALRERVQVLERALTEPSNRLSREIEDLRD